MITNYYWSSWTTVFWHAFTAVSNFGAFWDFVSCSTTSTRRFGERTASLFWDPDVDRYPQFYYRGITVTNIYTVILLWELIHIWIPEDGSSTFSETSVRKSATRYKVAEGIYKARYYVYHYTDLYHFKQILLCVARLLLSKTCLRCHVLWTLPSVLLGEIIPRRRHGSLNCAWT
jgi:hypothetical protein